MIGQSCGILGGASEMQQLLRVPTLAPEETSMFESDPAVRDARAQQLTVVVKKLADLRVSNEHPYTKVVAHSLASNSDTGSVVISAGVPRGRPIFNQALTGSRVELFMPEAKNQITESKVTFTEELQSEADGDNRLSSLSGLPNAAVRKLVGKAILQDTTGLDLPGELSRLGAVLERSLVMRGRSSETDSDTSHSVAHILSDSVHGDSDSVSIPIRVRRAVRLIHEVILAEIIGLQDHTARRFEDINRELTTGRSFIQVLLATILNQSPITTAALKSLLRFYQDKENFLFTSSYRIVQPSLRSLAFGNEKTITGLSRFEKVVSNQNTFLKDYRDETVHGFSSIDIPPDPRNSLVSVEQKIAESKGIFDDEDPYLLERRTYPSSTTVTEQEQGGTESVAHFRLRHYRVKDVAAEYLRRIREVGNILAEKFF